jgi:hypothetical protein
MTEATKTTKRKPRATATKAPAKKKTTASLDLPPNPLMFEILHLVSKQRSKAKKIEVLKKYETPCLKSIFIWNFDTTVESALPPGEVPYSGYDEQNVYNGTLSEKIEQTVRDMYENGSFSLGNTDASAKTTLRSQYQNLYHFVKGGNGGLSQTRREMMFINLLESVHPLEAEILVLVKDKELQSKYKVTKEIVAEAYPDIKWDNRKR